MCFEDNSLDIFITQDVLEHIFNPDKAFKEISRVLKPGGIHIFTVPCYDKETTTRAIKTQEGIKHLLEPHYHGDPINSDGCLVVTEWGHNLADFIYQHSQMKTERFQIKDPYYGLDGEFLDVFVRRKIYSSQINSNLNLAAFCSLSNHFQGIIDFWHIDHDPSKEYLTRLFHSKSFS